MKVLRKIAGQGYVCVYLCVKGKQMQAECVYSVRPRFVSLRTCLCHGCHVNREPSQVMLPH